MGDFLKTRGTKIVKGSKPVVLKGVNLGGWLMMEGYIMHAPNRAEQLFKRNFKKALGSVALSSFEKEFRANFICKEDFGIIHSLGFNCIRLPFNHKLIEKAPFKYSKDGLFYLDRAIRWARHFGLYVILDLHGAPGAQNHDWHSDSLGKAGLWKNENNKKRTYALWEFLADRYKDEKAVAGYDLLNEAVINDARLLNGLYKNIIKAIRKADKNHILFAEGNKWGMDLDCLDDFNDDNLALSVHAYQPLDFTFNFVPHLHYPLKRKHPFGKNDLRKILLPYVKKSKKFKRPVFVGEFGVNAREGIYGEQLWLSDMLSLFREFEFHWTYWTYKAVKNNVFPDGIFSYRGNPPWVNRPGPLTGWETYQHHWHKNKSEMVNFWKTENFQENTLIRKVLQNACR